MLEILMVLGAGLLFKDARENYGRGESFETEDQAGYRLTRQEGARQERERRKRDSQDEGLQERKANRRAWKESDHAAHSSYYPEHAVVNGVHVYGESPADLRRAARAVRNTGLGPDDGLTVVKGVSGLADTASTSNRGNEIGAKHTGDGEVSLNTTGDVEWQLKSAARSLLQ